MGLSETIVAAMIGAIATVGTALFQLLMAFKAARNKPDSKPKRGVATRSIFAVLALMAASAAGGFLYSQLLQEREREDIRAMRQELRELRDLTAARVIAHEPIADPAPEPVHTAAAPEVVPASLESTSGIAESIAYVPACHVGANETAECAEADGQRIALCGSVPAQARVEDIHLFAQPDAAQQPWEQHAALLDSDLGGARFTGKTFEYAQGQNTKAVCVNFLHWSSQHPHIARIVIQYRTGDVPTDETQSAPPLESLPDLIPATVAASPLETSAATAAFVPPATAAR